MVNQLYVLARFLSFADNDPDPGTKPRAAAKVRQGSVCPWAETHWAAAGGAGPEVTTVSLMHLTQHTRPWWGAIECLLWQRFEFCF